MISLLPNTTAADTNGAFAVLAVLGDKSAYKKALDDLVAQAKISQDALLNAQKAQKASEDIRAEAEAKLAEAADKLTKAQDAAAGLDTRAAALTVQINRQSEEHAARMATLETISEKTFKEREAACVTKEKELVALAKTLSDNRVVFDKWRNEETEKARVRADEHANLLARLNAAVADNENQAAQIATAKAILEKRVAQLRSIVGTN